MNHLPYSSRGMQLGTQLEEKTEKETCEAKTNRRKNDRKKQRTNKRQGEEIENLLDNIKLSRLGGVQSGGIRSTAAGWDTVLFPH